jgi:hypothetical protein
MTQTSSPRELSLPERKQILQNEMRRWLRFGYRVMSQTDTTAQMVRPHQFSFLLALILVFTLIGFVIYLLWYLTRRDESAFLEVTETGEILKDGRPWNAIAAAQASEPPPVYVKLPSWPFKILGAFFAIAMLVAVGLSVAERFAPTRAPLRGPREPISQTGGGEWRQHSYSFSTKNNEVTVRFSPPISSDQKQQTEVMRHLGKTIFGDDLASVDPRPVFDHDVAATGFEVGVWMLKFRPEPSAAGKIEVLHLRRE